MFKSISLPAACAAALLSVGLVAFAQSSGEATYKAKCLMCHSPNGAADTPVAKNMKVKPASDPEMKKLTSAQMIESVKNGKNRMPSFKDKLTDEQIKAAVAYFRSFK